MNARDIYLIAVLFLQRTQVRRTNVPNVFQMLRLTGITTLDPFHLLRTIFLDSMNLNGIQTKLGRRRQRTNEHFFHPYLLRVVFSQFFQLLTFIVLDAVQHRINLFGSRRLFSNAARATMFTEMIDDAQSVQGK